MALVRLLGKTRKLRLVFEHDFPSNNVSPFCNLAQLNGVRQKTWRTCSVQRRGDGSHVRQCDITGTLFLEKLECLSFKALVPHLDFANAWGIWSGYRCDTRKCGGGSGGNKFPQQTRKPDINDSTDSLVFLLQAGNNRSPQTDESLVQSTRFFVKAALLIERSMYYKSQTCTKKVE